MLTAQFQNMSQASRALNIAQPTLSKSIAALEQELGNQLFDRTGKKLILNDRGKQFLERVQASMQELDSAVSSVQNESAASTLKLGLFLFSGRLIQCISEYARQNPETLFHVEYLMAALDSIDTNEFDMLLYPRQVSFSRYRGEVIYAESFYLAVHKSNPLAEKKSISIAEIEGQSVILLKYGKNVLDIPGEFYNNSILSRGKHHFTNSHEIQREMIAENRAVGFVSHDCAGLYQYHSDIILLTMDQESLNREIMLGFKREKHLSESGKQFVRFVRAYFGLSAEEGN